MATNRIIQAVYDLKDNITAKLSRIGDAFRSNRSESNKTADAVDRDNKRTSESFKRTADSVGGLRKALGAVAAVVGLAKLKDGLLAVLNTGDKFELLGKRFEVVFGGIDAGSAALAKIKQLAKETPQTLDEVANAAVKLKAFGLDPLDGTLKALIDQNAKLGGSNEDLQNTILAVGQAWTKQKLQGDDIRQLLEKGIPVYDLLAKATGKTAQEIQKLSGAGLLGRDSIRALLTEIGKSADGAAASQMKTLTGLVSNLRDTFDDFLVRIANAGALDFVKAKLTELGDTISGLASSGKLQEVAANLSNLIIGTGKAVASTVKFVYDYSAALVLLAKAYAFVKVQSFVDGLAAVAAGTTKATGLVRLLATAITAIPAVRLAVIGGAAVALASDNLKRFGEIIGENLPATEKWTKRIDELKGEILAGAEVFRIAADRLAQFRDQQVLSADSAAKLSAAERAAQAERIAGLEEFLKLQIRYFEQLRAADALNADGLQYLETLKAKLTEAGTGYASLAEGARIAADALDNKLTAGAQALVKQLGGIGESSKAASSGIAELVGDFDKLSTVQIGDIALAVQRVGEQSDVAAQRVREGLAASLAKLSGADLLRFQISASAAFDEVGRSGDKTAVILDTTLRVAMERLKVDAAQTGEAFTKAGSDTVATFQAIAENARATGLQIEASFRAALGGVKTKDEAEALGAALQAAAHAGRVGFDQLAISTKELNERVRSITADLSPLASQFEILGIKSQAQLNAVRDNARDAFEAVVDGARKGTAAQEDVVRAFKAYSDAALAAVADSKESARTQVEVQLQVQAAALGIADAMNKAGAAGKGAADSTADAFGKAIDEIQGAADAAGNLKDQADDAASGLGDLADSAGRVSTTAQQAGINLGYMTEEAANAISAAVGVDGINNAMKRYADQIFDTREELDAFTRSQKDAADAASAASDELAKLTQKLREERDAATLSDSEKEQKRYEQELAHIQELADAAGVNARAQAAELRGLAEAEHKRKLAEIAAEAAARRAATQQSGGDAGPGNGGSSGASGFGPSNSTPGYAQGAPGIGGVTYAPTININGGFDLTSTGERKKLVQLLSADLRRALDEMKRRAA